MIVVDASVCLAWAHKDERTPDVAAIAQKVTRDGAVAPPHWPVEIANGLAMAVRRGRIDAARRDEILANFRRLPVEVETPSLEFTWTSVPWIAARFDLTAYDAAYLELAARRRMPLATLDQKLARAAREDGLLVLP